MINIYSTLRIQENFTLLGTWKLKVYFIESKKIVCANSHINVTKSKFTGVRRNKNKVDISGILP